MVRARVEADHASGLLDLERARLQANIDKGQSPASIQAKLIDSLPVIVERLPKPEELRSVTIGGTDGSTLAGLVAQLGAVLGAVKSIGAE